jgi:ribosomal protein S27E
MADKCPFCNGWHLRTIYNHDDTWSYQCDSCGRLVEPEDASYENAMEWQEEGV